MQFSLILALMLLLLKQGESVPFTKTFEQSLKTGTIDLKIGSAFPTVTSLTSATAFIYPIGLSSPMNNDNYKYALSIAGIDQEDYDSTSDSRYSLMVSRSLGTSLSTSVL
jgi:hypothetical protein